MTEKCKVIFHTEKCIRINTNFLANPLAYLGGISITNSRMEISECEECARPCYKYVIKKDEFTYIFAESIST